MLQIKSLAMNAQWPDVLNDMDDISEISQIELTQIQKLQPV